MSNGLPFDAVDGGDALLVVAVGVALILVVIPLVLFGLELIIFGWVVASGLVGRVVLGRPWVVEASVVGGGRSLCWSASGWRGSGQLVEEVTSSLAAGRALPPGAS